MSPSSFSEVLNALSLHRVNATRFVGDQLPAPFNHILGGHVGAQALIAAANTAPGRAAHSVHTYFLRAGDARKPVDFEVVELQEGRTFSARRVTARQDGQVLLEAMASFKTVGARPDDVDYQPPMPAVTSPEELPSPPVHFAESAYDGRWASLWWFERRIVDADRVPPARSRIWWRPGGTVPDDPALIAGMVFYLSAVTLAEPVNAARGRVDESAQRGHSVLFHHPAAFADWLLYDQCSPTSTDSLALTSGRMFNRNGDVVCTVEQETYFLPPTR